MLTLATIRLSDANVLFIILTKKCSNKNALTKVQLNYNYNYGSCNKPISKRILYSLK